MGRIMERLEYPCEYALDTSAQDNGHFSPQTNFLEAKAQNSAWVTIHSPKSRSIRSRISILRLMATVSLLTGDRFSF